MDKIEHIVSKHLRNAIMESIDDIEHELKNKFYEYVTDFYNDYSPIYYVRFGNPLKKADGLYNALQFEKNGMIFEWETNFNNFPKHNQDNSIVYNLVFINGLHGGIQTIRGYTTPTFSPSIDDLIQSFWNQLTPQLENFRSTFFVECRKKCVTRIAKEVLTTYGKR